MRGTIVRYRDMVLPYHEWYAKTDDRTDSTARLSYIEISVRVKQIFDGVFTIIVVVFDSLLGTVVPLL